MSLYVIIIVVICVLSFSPASAGIENFLIRKKNLVSKSILILAYLSLLLVFSDVSISHTGEWSLDLLWILLWLPIWAKVFNLWLSKKLMLFRKELGIWMGTLALVHSTQYFLKPNPYMPWEIDFWLYDGSLSHLAWWIFATLITIVLTLTSSNKSIKQLGKKWKLLHRTVYILLLLTLFHVAFFQVQEKGLDTNITLILTFIPFVTYFTGKICEWFRISLTLTPKRLIIWSIIYVVSVFSPPLLLQEQEPQAPTPATANLEISTDTSIPESNGFSEITPPIELEPEIIDTPELVPNLQVVIQKCDSLCWTDSKNYCTAENEVIFSDSSVTYGTCRSLSKYNKKFNRCQWFCKSYGNNKWSKSYCTLPDGSSDRKCDG